MGSFLSKKCPTLYVNDVDENQEATKHNSLFKVVISSSTNEKDPSCPSTATTHVQGKIFNIFSLIF